MIPRTLFDDDHELFRDQVRRFFETELAPHHEEWEEVGEVPRWAWKRAGELGFLCTAIPEESGGVGGDRVWIGLGTWLFAKNPQRALDQIQFAHDAGSHGDALFSWDSIAEHPEFRDAPQDELKHGLKLISAGGSFRERYDDFIGPLVYHPNPPTWKDVLNSLSSLASETLGS